MSRAQLDAAVLAWMSEPEWRDDEPRFEELALALFAHQARHCPAYGRFCEARIGSPDRVRRWQDIPPVPTGAFKEVSLRCFPAERTAHVFRTSGTSTRARGELALDTLDLYEASLLASCARHVFPEHAAGRRWRIRVLAPSPRELPDSSLSHMFGCVLSELGDAASGFDVARGELRTETLLAVLRESRREATPLALCGTSFAFVHLLDALARRGECVLLPTGSRVMETGGFKGRSRELTRDELYREIASGLGIPPERVVNQYGMTELGSQFYDSVLLRPGEIRRKLAPPWTRVRLIDPESGEETAAGETGVIVVYDLANTGSVLAVQTADLGRRVGDGFEVLGREPGAEERGCALAADVLLAGAAESSA